MAGGMLKLGDVLAGSRVAVDQTLELMEGEGPPLEGDIGPIEHAAHGVADGGVGALDTANL